MVKSDKCGAVDATVMNDVAGVGVRSEDDATDGGYVEVIYGVMYVSCFAVFDLWILVI